MQVNRGVMVVCAAGKVILAPNLGLKYRVAHPVDADLVIFLMGEHCTKLQYIVVNFHRFRLLIISSTFLPLLRTQRLCSQLLSKQQKVIDYRKEVHF